MSVKVGQAAEAPSFAKAARGMLGNTQLRHNVRHATDVIRARRAHAVAETLDWQQLRDAALRSASVVQADNLIARDFPHARSSSLTKSRLSAATDPASRASL